MNFTLKQLRYIEAAGRLGSIANAANELCISQSSVTAAIDALESELGYNLFIRMPAKGIQTTPTGEQTLSLVRRFIDQSSHFEADVKSVGGTATGLVRIACYATAAPSFLPPILKSLTQNFPSISVKILEGDMAMIMELLDNGEADLTFTYEESMGDQHEFYPLFTAPPYALVSADDPIASQSSTNFEQLAAKPMVMLELPRTIEYFSKMFESKGLKPNIAHSSRSSEIVRALVTVGFGFSLLNIRPPDYHENESRYRAVPIRDDVEDSVFGIATMATVRQPEIVRTFIKNCIRLRDDAAFESLIVK